MELQQFITTVIKAIGKGIEEGREGNIDPSGISSSTPVGGVEFDLGIALGKDEIIVVDRDNEDRVYISRIKFAIPVSVKRK